VSPAEVLRFRALVLRDECLEGVEEERRTWYRQMANDLDLAAEELDRLAEVERRARAVLQAMDDNYLDSFAVSRAIDELVEVVP
jgi:uncharacterized membrane protein